MLRRLETLVRESENGEPLDIALCVVPGGITKFGFILVNLN